MKSFEIPLIINGKIYRGKEQTLLYRLDKEEIKLLMPQITEKEIEVLRKGQSSIHNTSVEDIIRFYEKVGRLWTDKNYALRERALRLARLTTGYHEAMLERSYDIISNEILSREFMEGILESNFLDKRVVDAWLELKDTKLSAKPRGRILHILAGNAPPVSIVSMLYGSLTKNVNILKFSSGDPITPLFFVLSFRDVDRNHPITRTTSVVYWRHDSSVERKTLEIVDGVCVWGGYESISAFRKKTKPGQILLEYGPRKSFQFIGREIYNEDHLLKLTAENAAHDLVLYDQQACHSPQVAFVEEPAEKFCEALAEALKIESKKIPKGYVSTDEHATISHQRLMATFRGDKVYHPGTTEWTIILTKKFEHTLNHPLSRTLFVIEVKDLRDALRYVDPSVMVVAFSSKSRMDELKDEVTLRGADRVTLVGRMGYFPTGSPHEGRYDLSNLVRWVSRDLTKGELKIRELLNKLPKYRVRWVRVG